MGNSLRQRSNGSASVTIDILLLGPALRFRLCAMWAELARDAVEHTIHELHRFRSREFARDLQRLVDHHRMRCLRESQQFGRSRAQQIAVNRWHPFQSPVLRMLLDEGIDLIQPVAGHTKQIISESAHFVFYRLTMRPETFAYLRRLLLAHVALKEHLQREFATLAAKSRFAAWHGAPGF